MLNNVTEIKKIFNSKNYSFCTAKVDGTHKVPYDPITGNRLDITKENSGLSLNTILSLNEIEEYDALGVILRKQTQEAEYLYCLDLDNSIDLNHCVSKFAVWVIQQLEFPYCEISLSGNGLHLFFTVTEPINIKKLSKEGMQLEAYYQNRYIAITGNKVAIDKIPSQLVDRTEELLTLKTLLESRTVKSKKTIKHRLNRDYNEQLTDDEVLARIKRSKKAKQFRELYGGINNYGDNSKADMALCGILAYFTNGNADQVDRIFRSSGLMREKWDEKRADSTYGRITIEKSIKNNKER